MTDRSFTTECPVCAEELFNEEGIADQDVAEMICPHLIHSDCLVQVGNALNADGARFGVGGMGKRSGCPVCLTPVSMWMCSKEAADFPAFWTAKIEAALQEMGPGIDGNGRKVPVECQALRDKLSSDPSLTEKQRAKLTSPHDSGFEKSLHNAGSVDYSMDQVFFASFLRTKGFWHYDETADQIWLWQWSRQHPIHSTCNHCRAKPEGLKVCSKCSDSSMAAMYCGKQCQKADWKNHKKQMCTVFQVMREGGTRQEVEERLRAARS